MQSAGAGKRMTFCDVKCTCNRQEQDMFGLCITPPLYVLGFYQRGDGSHWVHLGPRLPEVMGYLNITHTARWTPLGPVSKLKEHDMYAAKEVLPLVKPYGSAARDTANDELFTRTLALEESSEPVVIWQRTPDGRLERKRVVSGSTDCKKGKYV